MIAQQCLKPLGRLAGLELLFAAQFAEIGQLPGRNGMDWAIPTGKEHHGAG